MLHQFHLKHQLRCDQLNNWQERNTFVGLPGSYQPIQKYSLRCQTVVYWNSLALKMFRPHLQNSSSVPINSKAKFSYWQLDCNWFDDYEVGSILTSTRTMLYSEWLNIGVGLSWGSVDVSSLYFADYKRNNLLSWVVWTHSTYLSCLKVCGCLLLQEIILS